MTKHYQAWEAWITGPANPGTTFSIAANNAKDAKTKASKWAQMTGGTWVDITPNGKGLKFYKSYGAGNLIVKYR